MNEKSWYTAPEGEQAIPNVGANEHSLSRATSSVDLLPGVGSDEHPVTLDVVADKEQVLDRALPGTRSECMWCGGELDSERSTKTTCSTKCRVALWRHHRRNPKDRELAAYLSRSVEQMSEQIERIAWQPKNIPYRGGHVSTHHDSVVQAALADPRADRIVRNLLSRPYRPWVGRIRKSAALSAVPPDDGDSACASQTLSESPVGILEAA